MKLNQLGIVLILACGGSMALAGSARGMTMTFDLYSFSRQYEFIPADVESLDVLPPEQAVSIQGEFAGKDLNGDGTITADELGLFRGLVTVRNHDGSTRTDTIDSDIEKIDLGKFNYDLSAIGSNLSWGLSFEIGTLRRDPDFILPNSFWFENFSESESSFSIGLTVIPGRDTSFTGAVAFAGQTEGALILSTPEPGNVLALGLLGLGWWASGRRKRP